MTIWLVRHGETAKNRERKLQGRSNSPLNKNGVRQAEAVRDYFKERGISFYRIYSSPLTRAVQTARIITGQDKRIITDDRLLEMDYGPYEGISLESPPPEIQTFFMNFVHNPTPEGMESLEHVKERAGDFLHSLIGAEAEDILIVTHAIALKGALEYLTPESKGLYWSRYIGNCAVFRTEYDGNRYLIREEQILLT